MRSHFTTDHCIVKVIRVNISISYIVDFVDKKIFL